MHILCFNKMRLILYIFCICSCDLFLSASFLLSGGVIWCWLTVMPCPPVDFPDGSLLKMLLDWTSTCASLFEEQLPRLGIAEGTTTSPPKVAVAVPMTVWESASSHTLPELDAHLLNLCSLVCYWGRTSVIISHLYLVFGSCLPVGVLPSFLRQDICFSVDL